MAKSVDLSKISTTAAKNVDKEKIKAKTLELREKNLPVSVHALCSEKYSMLIVLQGLDAAGKNSAVKRIFSGVNPIGCKVYGFVKPSQNEFDHDFLWRIHKVTPPAGMIYIYNRSHYEDILVPTVEKTFPADVVAKRYEHINNFERLLTDSNVRVLKFYLHISKEVQQTRLEERLAEKEVTGSTTMEIESREKWDQYIDVYEDIFAKTSKRNAPWVVVPADNKWYAAYVISKKIVETLEQQMKLDWPDLETERFSMQDEDEEK